MSYTSFAVKGSYLSRPDQILKSFGYVAAAPDKEFSEWQKFSDYLFEFANDDISVWGMWEENGWTVIYDPSAMDGAEEEQPLALSGILKTEVCCFILGDITGFYGFAVYDGNVKRRFIVSESKIDEDVNQPLKEERGLKIDSRITEGDITGLAENMGISLEGRAGQKYTVKHHRFNEKKQEELRIFMEQQKQVPVEKKPWWKFW